MSSQICPDCGSKNIDRQDASGQMVCTDCGTLLEENGLVNALEFVEGAGGASSMVGQFVSNTSSKAYTPGRNVYAISRDSRETTLAKGRQKIQEVASRLRLAGHFVDAAHRYFTIAVEKNFVQGRQTIHVVAACLYIACRQEKSQHMLIDFSDALQVNVYTLGTCFLKFRRKLGLKLAILDPALYIYRFAAHLDLDDKANAVALTALRLVGRMKRDWIVMGRRPAGICAAALLIAARAHGFSRHAHDVTRILRVCGLTVSSRVKEFEQTPSASLTLDQFNKVELETEADPPVFTKNRMVEARARAIQANNVELLQSGALDDPTMKGKKAAKWREGKIKQKHLEFERLYKSIESEMIQYNNKDDDGDGGNDEDEEETKEGESGDKEKDEEEEEEEDATQPTKKQKTVTFDKENSGDNAADETEKGEKQLVSIPSEWAKAYPKSKYGKAIILPDHATAEELLPATAPVQGQLDTQPWKESMPQEMMDDFDSIFRSPREVAEREAIFNKINKDYIQLQAQKEKHRASTEEAQNQDDQEMAEQEKGHERYRKRKNRGRPTAETTEDALLQAVANRKISRKINYDAMSAIFDDDGTFSTDARGMLEEENENTMVEQAYL